MTRHLIILILLSSLAVIYAKRCHPKCPENSSIDKCGTVCEPSCKYRLRGPHSCPICTKKSKGCRCNEGYLRDNNTGACVLPENCSICDVGESHLPCGTFCEATCANPFEPEKCKAIKCKGVGCRCDLCEGYVRDTDSGLCVKIGDCPEC